jgi:hypothetical protein
MFPTACSQINANGLCRNLTGGTCCLAFMMSAACQQMSEQSASGYALTGLTDSEFFTAFTLDMNALYFTSKASSEKLAIPLWGH